MHSRKDAREAKRLVKGMFREAEKKGCCREAWNLVSALRGPDDRDWNLKLKTTAILRQKITGLSQKTINGCGAEIQRGTLNSVQAVLGKYRAAQSIVTNYNVVNSDHFLGHIGKAVDVLKRGA